MKKALVVLLVFTEILVYGQSKNALFIGNSYTFTNDMPQMVADLASSAGDNLTWDMSAPAGYNLYWHTTNSTTLGLIDKGGWDFVVLQEYSQYPSEPQTYVDTYVYPSAKLLDTEINTHNSGAETVFYMTWGRKDGDADRCPTNPSVCTYIGMDDLTRQRYMYMAQANHAIVSPVGAVWRYIRNNYPSIDLYQSDGSHPSVAGSYAAACTFYTAFFRKNPANLTYNSSLSSSDASNIRNAAKMVVYDSLMKWHIGEYDPDTQAPTAPTSLTASDLTVAGFKLSWTAATDNFAVVRYHVFKDGTLYGIVTGTSTNITGLSPATSYSMTVEAEDAAGNLSAASSPLLVTTVSSTAITLNITGVTAASKAYDGTTIVTINTSDAALEGVVTGDVVTLVTSGATGHFASKDVGNGKTVNTSGFTITGTDAAKYILVQPTTSANITKIGLTISGVTVFSRSYNGATDANLYTTNAVLVGAVTGDIVWLVSTNAAGTFNNKNIGTGKSVTTYGFDLGGADADNYNLTQPSLTGIITAKALTITGVTASSKVYDGTTSVSYNISGAALSGVVSGDVVTMNSGGVTAAFDNSSTGTGKTVYFSGFTISGSGAGNYTLTQPTATADITGLPITVSGVTANNKVYTGTTAATLNTSGAGLVGVLSGDVVALVSSSATGNFSNKNVGTGKTVTTSGFTLSGTDAAKYLLTQPTTTANITQASITVTGLTAFTKIYDGENDAALNTETGVLTGLFGSDDVMLESGSATGVFSDKNVGTGKTIICSGFSISGNDAYNYLLTQPTGTGTIRAATVSISGVTAANKVYDATTNATINTTGATFTGVLTGDHVTLVSLNATGSFANKNVGTGKTVTITGFTLSGTDAGNYTTSSASATANITAASLSISGLLVNSRTYNRTTSATLNTSSTALTGLFSGDAVTINSSGASATFTSRNAGTAIPVTTTGFTLSGTDAGNYTLTQPTGTGTITQAPLNITGVVASNKIYDGTTDVVLNSDGAVLSGIFSPDAVSLITANAVGHFISKNSGTSVQVSTTGFAISGTDAANYSVNQPVLAATITPKALSVIADDQSKYYRERFTFSGTEFSASGLVEGDPRPNVTLSSPATSETAIAGEYVITIAGGAVTNYTPTYVNGKFTVMKDRVVATADDKSKIYGTANPKFAVTYTGFVNGEDVSVLDDPPYPSVTADENSDAGNYPITLTAGSDNNYEIITVPGNLEIKKAELLVTVDNKTRSYSQADPHFTFSITGFVLGQTEDVIDVMPVAASSVSDGADVGEYDITVSGGEDNNYSFVYENGKLTITKADQLIEFEEFPKGLRVTNQYQIVANATSHLPVTFEISDQSIATLTGNMLSINDVGPLTITVRQEGDSNWNPAPDYVYSTETLPKFDNISSLFTPNSDGMNDYWYIPELEDYGKLQVTVYNRYGQVVYKSDGYKNDWDGTCNGTPLPSGAYYYIIKSSVKGYIKGVVNIIR